MQALKIILAVILGIILFVSLAFMGLMVTLNQTVLNADFMVRQVDRLDVSAAASEIFTEDLLAALLPSEIPTSISYIRPIFLDSLDESEPWVKEQADLIVHGAYDYVQARSDSLSLDISFVGLRDTLQANLMTALVENPPPELLQLIPQWTQMTVGQKQSAVSQFLPSLMSEIPESIDLAEYLPDAVDALNQARAAWGYVNTAFWGSIGLVVLLVLLIVLVFRSVRGSCITLGVVSLLYGVLMLVTRFTTDVTLLPVLSPYMMIINFPPQITTWVTGLVYEILRPTLWLGVGFSAIGVVLIVAGAVLRRKGSDY